METYYKGTILSHWLHSIVALDSSHKFGADVEALFRFRLLRVSAGSLNSLFLMFAPWRFIGQCDRDSAIKVYRCTLLKVICWEWHNFKQYFCDSLCSSRGLWVFSVTHVRFLNMIGPQRCWKYVTKSQTYFTTFDALNLPHERIK